jgi:ArsR family transcriptional regulator, cadmium/lead-responsive transcriptional repressor
MIEGDAMAVITEAPFRLSEQPLEVEVLAKYFRAFGDPTRLRILGALTEGESSVGELVDLIGAPQPKVSSHLACLRWCGFVESRREFRTVHYRIADRRVEEMITLARSLLADNAEHVAACRTIDADS